jgi:pimeloyl-ACP methyl ester carboxylesterase
MARNNNSNAAIALETREFRVSSDPGIEIYVRNKHPAGMTDFDAATTVLFVHGATYPAESAFDLPLDGASWMDLIAREGYDVYLLDIRGYGLSTRPPQMDAPAADNPPFATAAQASDPIGAAQTPAVVRAPNGVIADAMRQAATGQMDWDPAEIRVPVLLIVAEWDRDTPVEMARELFARMVNAPQKRYIELGEGTHMVIMEKNRMQLIDEVQLFLDERPAGRGVAV